MITKYDYILYDFRFTIIIYISISNNNIIIVIVVNHYIIPQLKIGINVLTIIIIVNSNMVRTKFNASFITKDSIYYVSRQLIQITHLIFFLCDTISCII